MALLRSLLVLFLVGAFLGGVVASLVMPGVLAWYASPGAGAAMCECTTLVRDTVSRLLQAQLVGAIVGAVATMTIGMLVRRARAKHNAPPIAPTPPAPPVPAA